ncbi:MAG: NAD(P)H-dependent oxidoreductase [Leptospiraceae bacterium]|nr:NAD(P)H-dependent oxidoreductase [Leptospiraceae bacterium]
MKVQILFFHPTMETSKINRAFVNFLPKHENLSFRSLYNEYPNGFIDVNYEKKMLIEHDAIFFQHPFYWYSCPPLMKQWIDWVLELGWAYGKGGTALEGKVWKQIISSGGGKHAYTTEGFHKHTMKDFLLPFQRTAELCNMRYQEPFLIQAGGLAQEELEELKLNYNKMILEYCNQVVDQNGK